MRQSLAVRRWLHGRDPQLLDLRLRSEPAQGARRPSQRRLPQQRVYRPPSTGWDNNHTVAMQRVQQESAGAVRGGERTCQAWAGQAGRAGRAQQQRCPRFCLLHQARTILAPVLCRTLPYKKGQRSERSAPLGRVLGRDAVDQGILELLDQRVVDHGAEVLHAATLCGGDTGPGRGLGVGVGVSLGLFAFCGCGCRCGRGCGCPGEGWRGAGGGL